MTHPQHRLAELIDGEPQPSGAIITSRATVTASVTGEVRVGRTVLGSWRDEPEDLADAYFAAIGVTP